MPRLPDHVTMLDPFEHSIFYFFSRTMSTTEESTEHVDWYYLALSLPPPAGAGGVFNTPLQITILVFILSGIHFPLLQHTVQTEIMLLMAHPPHSP